MDNLRNNFEKFYEHSLKSWEAEPFKELLWRFYVQGSLDKNEKEISEEEVKKMIDDQCFIDFIQSCIENPQPSFEMKNGDLVEVIYPTDEPFTCLEDPSRTSCEGCKNDPDDCESVQNILRNRGRRIINLSKLCNVNKGELDQALLTEAEIKQLNNFVISKEEEEREDYL